MDHATTDVRQADVSTAETVGQLGVIDPQIGLLLLGTVTLDAMLNQYGTNPRFKKLEHTPLILRTDGA